MAYYTVLSFATAFIVVLGGLVWMRTRSAAFLLGIAFLYYWSLYGAWSIVVDKLGGDSGKQYGYLESKMFPVSLDDNYYQTLILYAAFILIVEFTLLFSVRSLGAAAPERQRLIWISHPVILSIAAAAGIGSYLIVRRYLILAEDSETPAYITIRTDGPSLFTLHQILNRMALVSAALGAAILCSGKSPRRLSGEASPRIVMGYLLVLGGLSWLCLLIGNKNELLFAGASGVLLYWANARRMRWLPLTLVTLGGLCWLFLVDLLRGGAWPDLASVEAHVRDMNFGNTLKFVASSNETFAAHFSMYGALTYRLAPTYGSSLICLLASAVPRAFWPGRPDDIYHYYARGVDVVPGQGYTIHHATGWYLNFDLPGVVIGAVALGWIWAKCFNGSAHAGRDRPSWQFIAMTLSPIMFTAYIPSLIRSGPEAYKGLVVEGFLIPVVVLLAASRFRGRSGERVNAS